VGVNTMSVYICSDRRFLRCIKEHGGGRVVLPCQGDSVQGVISPYRSCARGGRARDVLSSTSNLAAASLLLSRSDRHPAPPPNLYVLLISLNKKLALFYISEVLSDLWSSENIGFTRFVLTIYLSSSFPTMRNTFYKITT